MLRRMLGQLADTLPKHCRLFWHKKYRRRKSVKKRERENGERERTKRDRENKERERTSERDRESE